MGLVFGSGVVLLMTYFDKKMGVATGLASSGGAVGELHQAYLKAGMPLTYWCRRHGLSSCSGEASFQDWVSMDGPRSVQL